MRMLRSMSSNTFKDRMKKENIWSKLGITPIEDKMRENRIRWFGYVHRRPINAIVKELIV